MSMSYNSSSGQSSTFPIDTQENQLLDQIGQQAQGYANDLYNWAGSTFANDSAVTNEAVNNFFNTSAQMNGLSTNLTNQYNNLFAPENAQLVADANSYASPARMAVDMGMAGATQAQAGNAALANSEEGLRSYGIDPSAGRYAALDQASRVQNAANVAGAENQQRVADIQTGQQLRQAAVNVGAQLPAAISNVNNTAIQANTGASNAELANANTGANLYSVPDKYLSTAGSAIKLPFSGSQSTNRSSGSSQGQQPNNSDPSQRGGGGGGSPGGGYGGSPSGSGSSGDGWSNPNNYTQDNPNTMSGGGGYGGDPAIIPVTPADSGLTDQGSYGDPGGNTYSDPGYTDFSSGGDPTGGFGGMTDGGGDMSFARGGPVPQGHRALAPQVRARTYSPNYAAGGAVDASQSPSGGAITDDVPAQMPGGAPGHLNANEFVIPQDVALWKGQEFFQQLIDQSRKKRMTASAQPTQRPMR